MTGVFSFQLLKSQKIEMNKEPNDEEYKKLAKKKNEISSDMNDLKEFDEGGADRFLVKSLRKGEIVQIYKETMPLQKHSNWSDDDDDDEDYASDGKYEKRICHTRILIKQKDKYFIHLHKYEHLLLKTSQYMFRIGPLFSDEIETFLNRECSTRFGYDASYHQIQNPPSELLEFKTANETMIEKFSLKAVEEDSKEGKKMKLGLNIFGETPLCVAAQQGSLSCVKLFIDDMFEINTFTLQTVLIVAVIHGHDDIVEYLIEYLKINVGEEERRRLFINTHCIQHKTALHYACKYGNEKMVMMLLETGADPNIVSCFGPTPLMCTTNVNIIDMLVAKKADINAALYKKTTCLYKAVQNKNVNVVEKLLSYKETDTTLKNEENSTAEMEARRLQNHLRNFRESDYQLASRMVNLFEERTRRDIRDVLLEADKDICYDVISEITSYVI